MLFIGALLALAPLASASDVQATVRALEARYQHAHTLKAIFFERYSDGNGGVAAESGTVYFSRPGRMRWEYESPEQKLFLVDGTNVWFYVPADRTASRAKMKESSDWRTPLALLAGTPALPTSGPPTGTATPEFLESESPRKRGVRPEPVSRFRRFRSVCISAALR